MNYYYEIKLNFNDNKLYKFYEWSQKDKLDLIKKIPLIKIKSSVLKDIYKYDFIVSPEFIDQINGKTICKDNSKIENACLFCDTKNCIAIEFSNDGKSISRSSLMLEDENNICEISYSLKVRNIDIEKKERIKENSEFRQESNIKKIIIKEVLELHKNKDINKLKYLYYEWFNKKEDNIDVIIKTMFEDIKKELKEVHYNIYNIIKMSYNNV